jgi:hypothetical protein
VRRRPLQSGLRVCAIFWPPITRRPTAADALLTHLRCDARLYIRFFPACGWRRAPYDAAASTHKWDERANFLRDMIQIWWDERRKKRPICVKRLAERASGGRGEPWEYFAPTTSHAFFLLKRLRGFGFVRSYGNMHFWTVIEFLLCYLVLFLVLQSENR